VVVEPGAAVAQPQFLVGPLPLEPPQPAPPAMAGDLHLRHSRRGPNRRCGSQEQEGGGGRLTAAGPEPEVGHLLRRRRLPPRPHQRPVHQWRAGDRTGCGRQPLGVVAGGDPREWSEAAAREMGGGDGARAGRRRRCVSRTRESLGARE
jgi:hypothetical protein